MPSHCVKLLPCSAWRAKEGWFHVVEMPLLDAGRDPLFDDDDGVYAPATDVPVSDVLAGVRTRLGSLWAPLSVEIDELSVRAMDPWPWPVLVLVFHERGAPSSLRFRFPALPPHESTLLPEEAKKTADEWAEVVVGNLWGELELPGRRDASGWLGLAEPPEA